MANTQRFSDLISDEDFVGATPRCTLEWFGATTFRIRLGKLTIFADTWVQRPKNIKVSTSGPASVAQLMLALQSYISFEEITECDYIM